MRPRFYFSRLCFAQLKFCALLALLLFVGTTSSAQQKVVFSPNEVIGSSEDFQIRYPDSLISSDVTVKASLASFKSSNRYKVSWNSTITFSVKSGLIQQVVITIYDSKHRFVRVSDLSSGEFSNITGDIVTWTGNTDSFSFTANKNSTNNNIYIRKIEVTYIHLDLTLDETKNKNEIAGNMQHATVHLVRNFNANAWNSLVLPFDMTAEQVKDVLGPGAQLERYKGTTLNEDGSYTLNFEPTTTIIANEPVFVYGATKIVNKTIEDVEVKDGPATFTPTDAAFAFTGSYDKMSLQANDWFISSDNKFYLANGQETMKAMRAVFRPVNAGTAPQSLKSNLIERPTGVESVDVDTSSYTQVPIYNMAGQRVSENYRGIVIKGGKKYVNP